MLNPRTPIPMVSLDLATPDRVAGLDAQCWHVDGTLLGTAPVARIVSRFRINDPAATPREVLALVQAASMRGANRGRPGALPGKP